MNKIKTHYHTSNIITAAKVINQQKNQDHFPKDEDMKNLLLNAEEIVIENSTLQEFEFDGFSVVVENGIYAIQFEDAKEGLVIQNLTGENEKDPVFPYLFEVNGSEKVLTEEDYLRIKFFVESRANQ